jgi:hypothetical protein
MAVIGSERTEAEMSEEVSHYGLFAGGELGERNLDVCRFSSPLVRALMTCLD